MKEGRRWAQSRGLEWRVPQLALCSCADRTRERRAEGRLAPEGTLPLRHGVEVLDVGPSVKGQCVQVPGRLLNQA